MFKKLSRNKAFSLIEISVTLVIVGIIIVGVTQGLAMSKKFKLSSARSLTASSPAVSIKGLALWLDATSEKAFSDINISNSTAIETWFDTNAQRELDKTNLSQTTVARRPLYIADAINGLPSVQFDGVDDNLTIADLPGYKLLQPKELTMFLVANTDPSVERSYFTNWDSSGGRFSTHLPWNSEEIIFDFHYSSGRIGYTATDDDAIYKPHIFSFIHRSNEISEIKIDGSSVDTQSGLSHVMDTSEIADFTLGAANTLGGAAWKGLVGELIIFSRGLTALEVSQMEAYLGQKWGIKTPL